ncbi:Pyruvate dehydrogenase complex repressor [Nymphon striatum]|nr:Pyruvate dehydrogenase complex repressor [Nymphon striatum]
MNQKRLADTIAEKLETLIVEGSLKPGDRLPAERTLAENFGVSRPSLREAIQKLQSRGLLKTRPGGGTTVEASLNPEFVDPLVSFFQEHPESRFDVLEEMQHGMLLIRATDEDKERIKNCYEKMIELHGSEDPMDEARADADNQHRVLMEAVIAGDPEKARQAAQNHLAFVEDSLQEIDKEEVRKTRSLRRLTTLNALKNNIKDTQKTSPKDIKKENK